MDTPLRSRYDNDMSSSDVVPANTVQGEVIQPSHATRGVSAPAHAFFNVLRDILTRGNVYHAEDQIKAGLDAVDAYENQVVPQGDRPHVVQEGDRASLEDVTLRRAPGGPVIPATPAGAPAIDYHQLAAALVQAGAFPAADATAAEPETPAAEQ